MSWKWTLLDEHTVAVRTGLTLKQVRSLKADVDLDAAAAGAAS